MNLGKYMKALTALTTSFAAFQISDYAGIQDPEMMSVVLNNLVPELLLSAGVGGLTWLFPNRP